MGQYVSSPPLVACFILYYFTIMLKIALATAVLLAVVEGSYYGYGGYGGHGYGGYDGYGYGSYGSYGGYGYGGYGHDYGYGYDYPSYGYSHGYSNKYKRSVGEGQQVHVSGATGQTVVAPSHAYGAPAYGSYAAHSYAPRSYTPYSYATYYPRYSDYNSYPYVTATSAAYSYPRPTSYPSHTSYPSRHGYSSHGYGNVGYGTPTSFLYSRAQGYGAQGEVAGHYVAPYTYAPHYATYAN